MKRILLVLVMATMAVGCSKKVSQEAIGEWKFDTEAIKAEMKKDMKPDDPMGDFALKMVDMMFGMVKLDVKEGVLEVIPDLSSLTEEQRKEAEKQMKEKGDEKQVIKYDVLEDGKDSMKVKLHPPKGQEKDGPKVLIVSISNDTMTVKPETPAKKGGPESFQLKRVN